MQTGPAGGTSRAEETASPAAEEPTEEDTCLDCGALRVGPWCHRCGQRARPPLQPAPVLLRELAREFLDLDNRVFRSLRALLLRPGFLTREYCAGRRTRWTSPLRLYLLAAVTYFLIAGWSGTDSFLFVTSTDQAGLAVEWLPRILAAVVPAFALFHHVLFGRGGLWAESLVFSLHLHAGWFLLATVAAATEPFVPPPGEIRGLPDILLAVLTAASQLAILVYGWLALRRVHERGVWATTWRMVALIFLHATTTGLLLLVLFTVLLG